MKMVRKKGRTAAASQSNTLIKLRSVKRSASKTEAAEPISQPRSQKHKATVDDDILEQPSSKKLKKQPSLIEPLNYAPRSVIGVLVFGDGENGELGLGTDITEALTPRLNPYLDPSDTSKYHVVQIACGGMHTVALTVDNIILTWGVNDNFALGRNTQWNGNLRDVEDESDDGSLNPLESTPKPIPGSSFPPDARFVQVAAGDSCSFALTDMGLIYGWGTFRNAKGDEQFGYNTNGEPVMKQETPVLIRNLPKIIQIACGANHALALDIKGNMWAWGTNDENQLGRRFFGRFYEGLIPVQVRVCRNNAKFIACGEYHAFAIDQQDNVWGWGRNSNGEAGQGDNKSISNNVPCLPYPMKIPTLKGKGVTMLSGGSNHSAAITADGQCLLWGRADSGQLGLDFTAEQLQDTSLIRENFRGDPSICTRPTAVRGIGLVTHVASGSDHTIFINEAGKAYSTGFNSQGQLGLKSTDDEKVAKTIKGAHVGDRKMKWAGAGGRFSVIAWFN